jgi:hypothetical protein
VLNTGEIFELVENIKKISENVNLYISIYPDTGIRTENIEFSEKYNIPAERVGREIITGIKNSTRL